MVVEDDTLTREYLVFILRNEYAFDEVYEASDGATAWELFAKHAFKFILVDLLVPELDGLKLARRILDENRGRRILALSSECDD